MQNVQNLQNVQNMQNMQTMKNMQNMQSMQNLQNNPTKPNLPIQTYQIKPDKPNLPNQVKLSLPSILNQTYHTKITGQSSQRLGPQCLWQCFKTSCKIIGFSLFIRCFLCFQIKVSLFHFTSSHNFKFHSYNLAYGQYLSFGKSFEICAKNHSRIQYAKELDKNCPLKDIY